MTHGRFCLQSALVLTLSTMSATPVLAAGRQQPSAEKTAPRPPVAPQAPAPPQVDSRFLLPEDQNAEKTRDRLQNVMENYPPSLGEVLRRDPSLLLNAQYLAPYPALAAFLAQHPEIAHNPAYFLGTPNMNSFRNQVENDPSIRKTQIVGEMFTSLLVLTGFMSFFVLLGFVTKTLLDHRRRSRLTKVQTETHAKLMERLTSNEELLTYVQSSAGQRYLEGAPLPLEAHKTWSGAPYSRILWSVQAGTVAVFVGVGFLLVSARWSTGPDDWSADFARVLYLMGVIVLAAGAGLVLSGFASYALSRRFGLIEAPTAAPHA